jgi:hypothetical protein
MMQRWNAPMAGSSRKAYEIFVISKVKKNCPNCAGDRWIVRHRTRISFPDRLFRRLLASVSCPCLQVAQACHSISEIRDFLSGIGIPANHALLAQSHQQTHPLQEKTALLIKWHRYILPRSPPITQDPTRASDSFLVRDSIYRHPRSIILAHLGNNVIIAGLPIMRVRRDDLHHQDRTSAFLRHGEGCPVAVRNGSGCLARRDLPLVEVDRPARLIADLDSSRGKHAFMGILPATPKSE